MRTTAARIEQLPAVAELFDRYLGFKPGRLAELQERNREGVAFLALDRSERLLGAATASVLPRTRAQEAFPPGQRGELAEEILAGLPSAARLGFLHTSVVEEAERRKGVGSALLRSRLEWLRYEGASGALSFLWQHPREGARAASLMERYGLNKICEVAGFWAAAHEGGSECAACGAGCECRALLYYRDLQPVS